MTEKEEIYNCLKCQKEYCDNCMENDGREKKRFNRIFKWEGKDCTIAELAQIRKVDKSTMWRRIKTGGLEYAMSDVINIKRWKEIQGR